MLILCFIHPVSKSSRKEDPPPPKRHAEVGLGTVSYESAIPATIKKRMECQVCSEDTNTEAAAVAMPTPVTAPRR